MDGNGGITVGTRIWRQVIVTPNQKDIDDTVFEVNERGDTLIRANEGRLPIRGGQFWADNGRKGFVCFARGTLPKDWTYLEVQFVSKNGKSCQVKPVVGREEELLAQYEDDDGGDRSRNPDYFPQPLPDRGGGYRKGGRGNRDEEEESARNFWR